MITITGLDHLVLRSADAPRLITFYVDVLGCTVEREIASLGLTQLRAGDSLIDIVATDSELGRAGGRAPQAEGRNLDHFCVKVNPFEAEAIAAHLAKHGVNSAPPAPRYGADGTGPSIYLSDPDGNTVELKGPGDGIKPPVS
jgi:glyoxylase I family protein